jgi:plasmid stabilization system protein ParE
VKLVISPAAADDIEAAARWWDANRPKALGELRRAVMPKTRYLVYFLLLDDEVRILRVWHQSRTPPPSL